MSVSTQSDSLDDFVVTIDATDTAYVNVHTPYMVVSLIDWPATTINSAPFQVVIEG